MESKIFQHWGLPQRCCSSFIPSHGPRLHLFSHERKPSPGSGVGQSPIVLDPLCACPWHVPQLCPAPSAAPGLGVLAESPRASLNEASFLPVGTNWIHTMLRAASMKPGLPRCPGTCTQPRCPHFRELCGAVSRCPRALRSPLLPRSPLPPPAAAGRGMLLPW